MDQEIVPEVTDPDAIYQFLLFAQDIRKKDVTRMQNWMTESQRIKMDDIPHFLRAQVDAQRRVFSILLDKLKPKQKK